MAFWLVCRLFRQTTAMEARKHWVQTEAGKQWFIMFRFYGTTPAMFDKSWTMGDIETLK